MCKVLSKVPVSLGIPKVWFYAPYITTTSTGHLGQASVALVFPPQASPNCFLHDAPLASTTSPGRILPELPKEWKIMFTYTFLKDKE